MAHPLDLSRYSPRLRLDADGIWRSDDTAELSYPADGHATYLAIEDGSYWFAHRNRCLTSLVRQYPPAGAPVVFDVGGGNGFVARALEQAGIDAVVVEPGPVGARGARARGLRHVVCATTSAAGFRPESLPAVGLFDVVEHIEDDEAFLSSIFELLAPGGRLYVTVPAYGLLWSHEDVHAGHFRRYSTASLTTLLGRVGFDVAFESYLFAPLVLPIMLLRALPYRLARARRRHIDRGDPAAEHGTSGGALVRVVQSALAGEARLLQAGHRIPLGSSCIAVATKPATTRAVPPATLPTAFPHSRSGTPALAPFPADRHSAGPRTRGRP